LDLNFQLHQPHCQFIEAI